MERAEGILSATDLLVPPPESVHGLGGMATVSAAALRDEATRVRQLAPTGALARDRSLRRGGCRIDLLPGPDGTSAGPRASSAATSDATHGAPAIVVAVADAAGGRRAAVILDQLARAVALGAPTPAVRITDAPEPIERGLMLDVSRGLVPTGDALADLVDRIHELGFDHLQFYTEHTFAYPGCEPVWADASPITVDDLLILRSRALGRGLRLVPNQNCFGHLHRWLVQPEFAPLAETFGAFDFFGVVREGPFSLCPTDPASLEFVRERLSQLLPHFDAPYVNIGCDETADVGTGRSAPAAAQRGRGELYRAFVSEVMGIVREHGRRPMYWADIALRDPKLVAEMPADAIELAWGYEPHAPFEQWGQTLTRLGRTFWYCPGTSSWRSFAGRPAERRANGRAAAEAARRWGASGLLITEWGDLGHRQSWAVSLAGIAEQAALAWNPDASLDTIDAAIGVQVLRGGDGTATLGAWLRALGDADVRLRLSSGAPDDDGPAPLHNASALFEDLHPSGLPTALPSEPEPWGAVLDRVIELERTRPTCTDEAMDASIQSALAMQGFAARLACWSREADEAASGASGRAASGAVGAGVSGTDARRAVLPADRRDELHDRLRDVVARFDGERAWRARPGGAEESRAWWTKLERRLDAGVTRHVAPVDAAVDPPSSGAEPRATTAKEPGTSDRPDPGGPGGPRG